MKAGDNTAQIPYRPRALAGGRWAAIESLVLQVASAATTAILARLLARGDFGLIAIVTVVVGLLELAIGIGVGAAVVQAPRVTDGLLSSFFWLSLGLGAVASTVAVLSSPILAVAFGNAGAAPLLAVSSLTLFLGLIRTVPDSLLLRNLRFRSRSILGLAGFSVYSVTAIALATLTGLGAWSVVLARIGSSLVQLAGVFLLTKWAPRLILDWVVLREHLSFNLSYLGTNMVAYLSKNLDYLAVGRALGQEALGIYYLAYVLPSILRQRMTWVAQRVLFPVFARIRDEPVRLQRAYRDVLQMVVFLAMPSLLGLAALADVVVPVFFGGAWKKAANPMAILAVAAAVDALVPVSVTVFLAMGRPQRNLIGATVRLVTLSVGLGIAVHFGELVAFAWAVLLSSLSAALASQTLARIHLNFSWRSLGLVVGRAAIPSAAMVVAIAGSRYLMHLGGASVIAGGVVGAVVGASIFCGVALGTARNVFLQVARDLRRLALGGIM